MAVIRPSTVIIMKSRKPDNDNSNGSARNSIKSRKGSRKRNSKISGKRKGQAKSRVKESKQLNTHIRSSDGNTAMGKFPKLKF